MTHELAPATAAPDAAPAPDRALTIPAKRLAGSDSCLNCGSPLHGPFCHFCGQPDRKFLRFFPVLVREMLSDALDLDSRFLRTMKPLLFQPGRLTRDYLSGRRFRYTPPMRLYIFSSMAFFIVAALLASNAITIGADEETIEKARTAVEDQNLSDAEREELRRTLEDLDPDLASAILGDVADPPAVPPAADTASDVTPADEASDPPPTDTADGADEAGDEEDGRSGIYIMSDEPWDKETNPVVIAFMPDFVNEWINDEIEESPAKGKEIEANPDLMIDKVFDVLPAIMFLLLPLVALLLKFWYLFAGRYYIEHLIMALHNHAFIFVIIFISMMLNALAHWQEPSEEGPITSAVFWLNTAMTIWVPVYLLIAMKRVYEQGWLLTVGKYFVVGVSYLILLGFFTSVTAALSFVLL